MRNLRIIVIFLSALTLFTACNGGGSSGSGPAPVANNPSNDIDNNPLTGTFTPGFEAGSSPMTWTVSGNLTGSDRLFIATVSRLEGSNFVNLGSAQFRQSENLTPDFQLPNRPSLMQNGSDLFLTVEDVNSGIAIVSSESLSQVNGVPRDFDLGQ